jgi:CRP-like cAMP-binding protein
MQATADSIIPPPALIRASLAWAQLQELSKLTNSAAPQPMQVPAADPAAERFQAERRGSVQDLTVLHKAVNSEVDRVRTRIQAKDKAASRSALAHFSGEQVPAAERFRRAVRRIIFLNRLRRMVAAGPKMAQRKRTGVAKLLDQQIRSMFNSYEYANNRRVLDSEEEKLPVGILHPEALVKIIWDVGMLILVVFFAFAVPYRIGFDVELSPSEEAFDVAADILFIGDIILSFRTAYIQDGILVSDGNKIAKDYLASWFPLDFLASFPIGWFVPGDDSGAGINKLFRMLRLFKLFRILRLLKLFPRVMIMIESAVKLNPAMLRFLRSFVALFMLWHFIGATYYFIVREEMLGVVPCTSADGSLSKCFVNHCLCGTSDPTDFQVLPETDLNWYDPNNPDQWVVHPEVAAWPDSRRYWTALFWAVEVTTGIGNDIIPKSNMEIMFTVSMTIIGLMMYSVIIGSAASALQEMDTASTERRQKLDEVTNYLRGRKVPTFFQKIIKDFYKHMWSVPGKSTKLFDDLPAKLRSRLQVVLNRDFIDRIPVLQYLPMEVYIDIVPRMQSCTFLPGEFIVNAGDLGDCLYFNLRGKVDAVLNDKSTVYLSVLPGDFFGESALIWGTRYSASFRAVDFVDLLQLSRSDYHELDVSAPAFTAELHLRAMTRRSQRLDAETAFIQMQKTVSTRRMAIETTGLGKVKGQFRAIFGKSISVAPASEVSHHGVQDHAEGAVVPLFNTSTVIIVEQEKGSAWSSSAQPGAPPRAEEQTISTQETVEQPLGPSSNASSVSTSKRNLNNPSINTLSVRGALPVTSPQAQRHLSSQNETPIGAVAKSADLDAAEAGHADSKLGASPTRRPFSGNHA